MAFTEMVLQAYDNIGFGSYRSWLAVNADGKLFCCGMAAVVLDRNPCLLEEIVLGERSSAVSEHYNEVIAYAQAFFKNTNALDGFTSGFDGTRYTDQNDKRRDSRAFRVWHAIGTKTRLTIQNNFRSLGLNIR